MNLNQVTDLSDSSILAGIQRSWRELFVMKLCSQWLPGRQYGLLYRGLRDGMTPRAFHGKCDGNGATLVLISAQSRGHPVSVFGGYASLSWSSDKVHRSSDEASDTFLFSVVNPFHDQVVKLPIVNRAEYVHAMFCFAGAGPVFGDDAIAVRNAGLTADYPFDGRSCCMLSSFGAFGDPFLRGGKTFTGAKTFQPVDIEVWAVSGGASAPAW
jgi:hypothetical protein